MVTRKIDSSPYTKSDVEHVIRRLHADLILLEQITKSLGTDKIHDYIHDITLFADIGYLNYVDISVFDGLREVGAIRYKVYQSKLASENDQLDKRYSHFGLNSKVRIIVCFIDEITNEVIEMLKLNSKLYWTINTEKMIHENFDPSNFRYFSSGDFGMKRLRWNF